MKNVKQFVLLLLSGFSLTCMGQNLQAGLNNIVVVTASKSASFGAGQANADSMKGEIWLPSDWATSPTRKYPLVLAWGGSGQDAQSFATSSMTVNNSDGLTFDITHGVSYENIANPTNSADVQSFIIMALQPNSVTTSDAGTYQQIYRWINAHIGSRLDTNRLFLTGLSEGAGNVVQAVTLKGQDSCYRHYKGIVALNPELGWQPNFDTVMLRRAGIRMWIMTGTSDPAITAIKQLRDTLNKHDPGQLDFTTYAGGHCCWIAHYNTTYIDPTIHLSVVQWFLVNSTSPVSQGYDFLPVITGSVKFKRTGVDSASVSFTAFDTIEVASFEVLESSDGGLTWHTALIINCDGDKDYQQTFAL